MRSTIALDHPQNGLLIEVTGQSSRTFAEEFQYAFLLIDAKGKVIDSKFSREPQYQPADLKPGEYSVEAVAYDRDLLTSDPLSIRFSIAKAPFPWTATALGVLLAIALIALIWAMIERKRIVLRNRELAAARFDLANEAERERGRIARDLHDQTLADLRGLMMKSDRLAPAIPEFRSEIESVSSEIRRICEDLSPSVLENVGLIAALEFLLSKTIAKHKFIADDELEEKVDLSHKVKLQIYRIVQEILSNISRHSTAGFVEMKAEVTNGRFRITISDDGDHFEPTRSNANGGRGISNIRSRANIIGAGIKWKERPDGGSVFSLTIKG
jgi:signal transduction histidine kinase